MLMGQIVNKMPAPHLRRKDDALVDSETMLGVEVEVEGCKSNNLSSKDRESGYWTAKEDHSLREGGMEFVFSEPLFGTDVVQAVTYLMETAKTRKWKISERTGIHAHVDMRGMELSKFQNFCILYALVEPAIYRWVGEGRDRNIHCLPWYAADADLDMIAGVFKEPNLGVGFIKQMNRYSGLNLNSLQQFGTAEFRHLKTTFDTQRMLDWLNIILSLKRAAVAWQGAPADLIKEIKILRAYGFLFRVFGGTLISKLWYPAFEVDFRGISLPVAEYLVKASTKESSERSLARIRQHIQNETEETGEHPGFVKWKAKKGNDLTTEKKKPIPTLKSTFGYTASTSAALNMLQTNALDIPSAYAKASKVLETWGTTVSSPPPPPPTIEVDGEEDDFEFDDDSNEDEDNI